VDDRADDGTSPVIDAQVVDVKVHVDEELNAYNRYLGELSWKDPPSVGAQGGGGGRRGTAKASGPPVSPPANSIEGQRSELPSG
jgi:hypothetical protein